MQPFQFFPQVDNKVNVVPMQPFQMYVPNHNVIVPQACQENIQQYHQQPIFFEPLPPVYVKNHLLPSPILVQMPTTVVVQNESQPAMVLSQPPSNIVVKNNPPTSVFVKQSNPNVVVKNEAAPNYVQSVEACQEGVMADMNRPMMTTLNKNIL
ncbi:conserved Plasmodium protein, unknown function [Plasmodium knowlesi strain H]|uniref:Pv-fam-g protein n=3 Tax=Plasmodium knowlesi TaxID=5850 RepID=A0A5K1USE7_PLAKH|nr:conserved protein, unknown function [Plasmodium knowlesi strain H]OTN65276.1 Uncharacterized protein PKNOH_S110098100 [Plasmodium knowlesi]CAA9989600.1 conserved protein, unknown function [Plasmodium knowlesi strain H]SBO22667.1 conserved Plasmodium protein, unknown function [Plasmodium knowlesi strain H]SBO23329.1 conserved Plasmodium protein, unknown function [Plasmodium knowlesi strain H]VVS79074.1 conserved protein, unknown function [Plasmodium knowlesi strain H]|eukprot:XP_002260326.1 hypothetical protein, conserved in Plasmodium species [Plasmodium knowlesi strain H]